MPASTTDYSGSKSVGSTYRLMLTARGAVRAAGPLLIASMRQASGSYMGGLHVIAAIMAVSNTLAVAGFASTRASLIRAAGVPIA